MGVSTSPSLAVDPARIERDLVRLVRTRSVTADEEAVQAVTLTAAATSAAPIAEAPAKFSALRMLRNMALFLAAPFIGLLYAMLFPFIVLGMLAWTGVRALENRPGPQ